MSRPKNKDEYRAELADTFAHVLEEKGWNGRRSGAAAAAVRPRTASPRPVTGAATPSG